MVCARCNASRPENAAPCPKCGAASSLASTVQDSRKGQWGSSNSAWSAWSSSEAPSSGQQWNNQPAASVPQPQAVGWGATSSSWNAQAQADQRSAWSQPQAASSSAPAAQPANVPLPPWQSSFQASPLVEQSPSNMARPASTDQRHALLA